MPKGHGGNAINITGASTLNVNGVNDTLTLAGDDAGIFIADAATLTVTGKLNLTGDTVVLGNDAQASGTIIYGGDADQSIDTGLTYYNFMISGSSSPAALGADLDVNGNVTISNFNTFNSGGYNINVAGNWKNDGTFTPGTGTVIFDGTSGTQTIGRFGEELKDQTFYNVTLDGLDANATFTDSTAITNGLTVDAAAYAVTFQGTANTIAGNTSFLNTGTLALGNGTADVLLFDGGVTATAPSGVTLNGQIRTSGDTMSIGDADTAVTLAGTTSVLDSTNNGGTDTGGAVTIGGAVDGTADNTQSLTVNAGTGGSVNFSRAVGGTADKQLKTLTILSSNGTNFSGNVTADTSVVLTDTENDANITFAGVLVTPTLTTANQGYNIDLFGNGTTITALLEFLNTGTVTLGSDAADTLTFNGGIETVGNGSDPSSTTLNGTTVTSNDAVVFGTTTVSGDSTINPAGGAVTLGAVTINNTKTLIVGTGDTGAISFGSTVNSAGGTGNLTINTDDTATLSGHIGTTPLGTLTLTKGDFDTTGKNITAGAITVNAGTFNSTNAAGTWDLSGGVTIASGAALNVTSGTFTVGGNWSNSETFTSGSNTVTMDGSDTQIIGGSTTFNNLTIANTHASNYVDASGSTLVVSNILNITVGKFKSASDYKDVTIGAAGTLELSDDITVSGNWTNSGALTPGTHKVTLDGTLQTLSGATTFYDLTKNVTSADTLTFTSKTANRTTITHTLDLKGQDNKLLFLRSSSDNIQWEIDPKGTRNIAYLDVKDSNNTNANPINAGGANCTDSNNNTNWVFTIPSTKVDLTGPSTVTAGAVSTAFTLTSQDADGDASNVTADTKFDLSSNSSGTKVFYSNAGGTSVINDITITNGTSAATFYYKDTDKGTPTLTAAWNSGGTDLGSDTFQPTVDLAETTLVTSTTVASAFKDFKVTVTNIQMYDGTAWVTIFSGTAELDLVGGGTFPGISDVALPFGTYSKMKVTFQNSLPVTGTLTYGGTPYYTTADTFGGDSNIAGSPSDSAASQTVFTYRIEEWGVLGKDVEKTFDITPITVDASTDYQPILRFTISKTFLFKGSAGTKSTYYFALSAPTVSIVQP